MGEVAHRTLGMLDLAVLAMTLLTSAAIGVYFRLTGGRQQTNRVRTVILIVLILDCINKRIK